MDNENKEKLFIDYNPLYAEDQIQLDIDNEFVKAKNFLQKQSGETGDNLYDHLSDLINKILAERPENIIDFFEEYSRKVKELRYKPITDHLQTIFIPPEQHDYCKMIKPLILIEPQDKIKTENEEEIEKTDNYKFTDLMGSLLFWERCGIGWPREEMIKSALAIRQLAKTRPVKYARLWGKIMGINKNYIIAETEINEEELTKRQLANEEAERQRELEERETTLAEPNTETEMISQAPVIEAAAPTDTDPNAELDLAEKIKSRMPEIPKTQFKPDPEIPPEFMSIGVNKKVYFVCNEPGSEWMELPDVTPKQIVVARQILKYFTGNLDQEVYSYPRFPGKEREYLRAQIARITAGTHVSPRGYYVFTQGGGGDGEEEEEEEEVEDEGGPGDKTECFPNKRYEPPHVGELTSQNMAAWVHHALFILPQGRTRWWNPNKVQAEGEEEEMGEEEEEEEDKGPEIKPEFGPPLLTPLSEDASMESVPPWTVRLSPPKAMKGILAADTVFVRSNLWPGAYTYASGKDYNNIYIGWGHKNRAINYSPAVYPPIQAEYPIGPEVSETVDPTFDEEEAWRIAHMPKLKSIMGEGEEMGEEVEEEEEDEEDD